MNGLGVDATSNATRFGRESANVGKTDEAFILLARVRTTVTTRSVCFFAAATSGADVIRTTNTVTFINAMFFVAFVGRQFARLFVFQTAATGVRSR